ncbi:MAG: 30S ribosomal protein S8 [Lentisphaerae bacterium GWF2_52_8]|nr:MAG: 30S ribosomal protein S8 [Lentisphaerae bacterium GWF2_52_8]
MNIQDPIADMLVRIKNASLVGLPEVKMPNSKQKSAIACVMKDEGYIKDFSVSGEGVKKSLVIQLKYAKSKSVIEGVKRVSKPSCRIYCGSGEVPKVRNGLGTVIISTSNGIISGRAAVKQNVGGEVLCYVW